MKPLQDDATAQEVFDFVAGHLFQQGERAVDIYGSCRYRAENGKSCAIGCLIPDDLYVKEMECNTINEIVDLYSFPKYINNNIDMIRRLQHTHDIRYNWDTTSKMKDSLKYVAEFYRLDEYKLNTLSFKDR